MIRLLLLVRSFAGDGPNRLVATLLDHWTPDQVRADVFALEEDGPMRVRFADAVARLGGELCSRHTGWGSVPVTAAAVRAFIRKRTHDVVHAHLFRPDAVGRLAVRGTRAAYLTTDHGLHDLGSARARAAWVRGCRLLGPATARLVAISAHHAATLESLGFSPAEVRVVPNGIDLRAFPLVGDWDRLAVRERLGLDPCLPIVALVGSLIPRKAPVFAVEVFAALRAVLPHAGLIVAGEGPLAGAVEQRAQAHDIAGAVRMLGHQPSADVLAAADVLLHPAWEEPFGLAVAEALASGIPAVVRHGTGAADLINSTCGAVVDSISARVWAESLEDTLRTRVLAGGRSRIACRVRAESMADARACARRHVELYRLACTGGA